MPQQLLVMVTNAIFSIGSFQPSRLFQIIGVAIGIITLLLITFLLRTNFIRTASLKSPKIRTTLEQSEAE